MTHKRQQNTIRTDYLENWIGFYRAHRQPEKADALIKISRDNDIPIELEEIERCQSLHASHVAWRDAHPV